MLRSTKQSAAGLFFIGLCVVLIFMPGCSAVGDRTSTSDLTKSSAAECCLGPLPDARARPTVAKKQSEDSQTFSQAIVTDWIPSSERTKHLPGEIWFTTQEGKKVKLQDLFGRPIALSFLYTRCDNPRKCPLVASTMGQLQKLLDERGLSHQVQLLLITYDPEHDSPVVLTRFGLAHGLRFDDSAIMLQPDSRQKEALFKDLNVGVNFDGPTVNLHSIQLMLFDSHGRCVRTYHRIIWNNDQVLGDLKRLLGEMKLLEGYGKRGHASNQGF